MKQLPPAPTGERNLLAWANKLYLYLLDEQAGRREVEAHPVFLMHRIGNEKATTDGIMMYDPDQKAVVVSSEGQWKALAWAP